MITARHLINLYEKRLSSASIDKKLIARYENPTSSDIEELSSTGAKDVVFIINDRDKTIFVWDAKFASVEDFSTELVGVEGDLLDVCNYIIYGKAQISGSSLVVVDQDNLELYPKMSSFYHVLSRKWGWVDKYLNGFSKVLKIWNGVWINTLKKRKATKANAALKKVKK